VEDVVADHSMVGPGRAGRWHLVRRVGSPAWSCPEGLAEAHGRVRARRQREARAALLLVEGDGRTHAVPPTPRRAHRRRRGGAARAGRCRTSQRPHTRSDGPRPTSSPRAVGSREVREPRWRAPGWARKVSPPWSIRSIMSSPHTAPAALPARVMRTDGCRWPREVVLLAAGPPAARAASRTRSSGLSSSSATSTPPSRPPSPSPTPTEPSSRAGGRRLRTGRKSRPGSAPRTAWSAGSWRLVCIEQRHVAAVQRSEPNAAS
jgi:hypothetical protein